MTLHWHRFDPAECDFPRPRVPLLPPLDAAQLTLRSEPAGPELRHYARGRYALRAAYELCGVGPQGALLAPAYHCRTMLDPALRLGADVQVYHLTPDLHADLESLDRAAAACAVPPKALLFTHYFGLPRDIAPVAAWCERRGMALVEDCSHALAPASDSLNGGVGRTGRYASSSPYKFRPCPDGGLLWANGGAPLPPQPAPPGLRAQAGGLLDALRPPRSATPEAAQAAAEIAAHRTQPGPPGRDWIDTSGTLSPDYDPGHEQQGSLASSRWLLRHTSAAAISQARRARYAEWVSAVRGLPGCRALLPELPAQATPYMFPLLVDEPAKIFPPLKRAGMPIWRWDDMAVSACKVSQRYRQGVFHLPCHQALSPAQMAWMTAALHAACTGLR